MPNDSTRNLSKIRDKDGVVELRWWTPNGADRENGELTCKDKPTEDFIDAMQALAPVMSGVLELPKDWGDERIVVTTVSLSERGEKLGVIISGSCRVAAGGFGLNTPLLHEPSGDDAEAGPSTLTPERWAQVTECAKQAHLYLGGDRVQRSLGLQDGGGEEEEASEPQLGVV